MTIPSRVRFGRCWTLAVVAAILALPAPCERLAPNDPLSFALAGQGAVHELAYWHFVEMRVPEAWAVTTGDPGVLAAMVDRGADLWHEDLGGADPGRIWTNAAESAPGAQPGVDDDGNGYVDDVWGWNFNLDSNAIPPDAHGATAAGTLAAVTNNALGGCGMAGGWGRDQPGCRLLALVAPDPYLKERSPDLAAAIRYAVAQGARVICVTIGEYEVSSAIRAAVEEASAAGAVVVTGAHNQDVPFSTYLARRPEVVVVGALSRVGRRSAAAPLGQHAQRHYGQLSGDPERPAPFAYTDTWRNNGWGSNYGPEVDVMAPGLYLWSLDPMGLQGWYCRDPQDAPTPSACRAPAYRSDPGHYRRTYADEAQWCAIHPGCPEPDGWQGFTTAAKISGATPQGGGAAALVASANRALSGEEIGAILRVSCDDLLYVRHGANGAGQWLRECAGPGPDRYTGFGRINAERAVRLAQGVRHAAYSDAGRFMGAFLCGEPSGAAYYASFGYNLHSGYGDGVLVTAGRVRAGLGVEDTRLRPAADDDFVVRNEAGESVLRLAAGAEERGNLFLAGLLFQWPWPKPAAGFPEGFPEPVDACFTRCDAAGDAFAWVDQRGNLFVRGWCCEAANRTGYAPLDSLYAALEPLAEEGFEDGVPAQWTQTSGYAAGPCWQVQDAALTPVSPPEAGPEAWARAAWPNDAAAFRFQLGYMLPEVVKDGPVLHVDLHRAGDESVVRVSVWSGGARLRLRGESLGYRGVNTDPGVWYYLLAEHRGERLRVWLIRPSAVSRNLMLFDVSWPEPLGDPEQCAIEIEAVHPNPAANYRIDDLYVTPFPRAFPASYVADDFNEAALSAWWGATPIADAWRVRDGAVWPETDDAWLLQPQRYGDFACRFRYRFVGGGEGAVLRVHLRGGEGGDSLLLTITPNSYALNAPAVETAVEGSPDQWRHVYVACWRDQVRVWDSPAWGAYRRVIEADGVPAAHAAPVFGFQSARAGAVAVDDVWVVPWAFYPRMPGDEEGDADRDGWADGREGTLDRDGDGLPDYLDPDNDGDGLDDAVEREAGLDPGDPGDADSDADQDGLTAREEVLEYGTDPADADSDGDGMPDGWEAVHGLDPVAGDAEDDPDGDGVTNGTEYAADGDPHDPAVPFQTVHVAASGDDAQGTGGPEAPWRTVAHAAQRAAVYAWAERPVTIRAGAGLFEGDVALAAHTRLMGQGAGTVCEGRVRILGETAMAHCALRLPGDAASDAALIAVAGGPARLEDVELDGAGAPGSTGIEAQARVTLRRVVFLNVAVGLRVDGGFAEATRCRFEDIAGPSVSVGAGGEALLGDRACPSATGFNVFRRIGGALAENASGAVLEAAFNDWGVYDAGALAGLMTGLVDAAPWLDVDLRTLAPCVVAVELTDAATGFPLPGAVTPTFSLGGAPLDAVPGQTTGYYFMAGLPAGRTAVAVTAASYSAATFAVHSRPDETGFARVPLSHADAPDAPWACFMPPRPQ